MRKILIFAISLSMISCGGEPQKAQTTPEEVLETIEIVEVVDSVKSDAVSGATNIAASLVLNGTMTVPPQSNITITLPISGIVSSFTLLPGTAVQKGETIAVLENTEFVDMQQIYLEAVAQIEYLEAEYVRQTKLAAQDVTSQKRLQQSKADFLSTKSRKEAMRAKLSMLGIAPEQLVKSGIVERLTIKAPQSGYISEVMANQGKFVDAGEPICQIINKSQILLNLIAYEKDLGNLKIGQKITFRANGLGTVNFRATITAIDQRVDPVNRSVKVYAKSDTIHSDFRPGMYVSAMIID